MAVTSVFLVRPQAALEGSSLLLSYRGRPLHEWFQKFSEPELNAVFSLDKAKELAFLASLQGMGHVSPNPPVGCAILDDQDRLLALGWHQRHGHEHAEEVAINQALQSGAGDRLRGARVIVTLEPCSHHGKRPPCSNLLKRHGVGSVLYGIVDPDPRVNGAGIAGMQRDGIRCLSWGVEWEVRLRASLAAFIKNKTQGKAYFMLKAGLSLEGSIARRGDQRQFLSGAQSRLYGHFLRLGCDAIVVGIGTLLADDPGLDVRGLRSQKNPVRIIYDPEGKLPHALAGRALKFFERQGEIVVLSADPAQGALDEISARHGNISVLSLAGETLASLPERLHRRGLHSILLEGGRSVYDDFLAAGIVDQGFFMWAPKLLLGENRVNMVTSGGHPLGLNARIEEVLLEDGDLMASVAFPTGAGQSHA